MKTHTDLQKIPLKVIAITLASGIALMTANFAQAAQSGSTRPGLVKPVKWCEPYDDWVTEHGVPDTYYADGAEVVVIEADRRNTYRCVGGYPGYWDMVRSEPTSNSDCWGESKSDKQRLDTNKPVPCS